LRSIDRGFFERGEISLNPWFMQQALFTHDNHRWLRCSRT
jgi:hypothetical protein